MIEPFWACVDALWNTWSIGLCVQHTKFYFSIWLQRAHSKSIHFEFVILNAMYTAHFRYIHVYLWMIIQAIALWSVPMDKYVWLNINRKVLFVSNVFMLDKSSFCQDKDSCREFYIRIVTLSCLWEDDQALNCMTSNLARYNCSSVQIRVTWTIWG